MQIKTILEIMVEDHNRLLKLLDIIDAHKGPLIESFSDFVWNFEKHVFIEEKAIFTTYNTQNVKEDLKVFQEISKQHTNLLEILEIMRKESLKKKHIHPKKFRKLLIDHKTFEEESVYPKLDQGLGASEKKEIIKRISEII